MPDPSVPRAGHPNLKLAAEAADQDEATSLRDPGLPRVSDRWPLIPMLAKTVDSLPPADDHAQAWFEPKFDGFRGLLYVERDRTWLQARDGSEISGAFPEVVAAARRMLPADTVVDGELLAGEGSRYDFSSLQRRLASPSDVPGLVYSRPASMVLFDVLVHDGVDVRERSLAARRHLLEGLELAPPLRRSPYTLNIEVALGWIAESRREVTATEGLMIKDPQAPYIGGRRGWAKYRVRDTFELVVGAITGDLVAPRELILGYHDEHGRLVIAGSSSALSPSEAAEVGVFMSLPPRFGHPWPDPATSGTLWQRDGLPSEVVLVDPRLVIEVTATAHSAEDHWREVVKFVRARPDLVPTDITAPARTRRVEGS